jgi:hypothetical protein
MAYKATSSKNKLATKEKGAIRPCQRPPKKPYDSAPKHASTGKASAQLVKRNNMSAIKGISFQEFATFFMI